MELKQECIERMKLLKLDEQIIQDFITNDTIYISKIGTDLVKVDDEQIQIIKQYEDKENLKIYHIAHFETQNSDTMYFLCVRNNNANEWKSEKTDIRNGFDLALCYKKEKFNREIGITVKDGKVISIV